eukprot:Opistho-2@52848
MLTTLDSERQRMYSGRRYKWADCTCSVCSSSTSSSSEIRRGRSPTRRVEYSRPKSAVSSAYRSDLTSKAWIDAHGLKKRRLTLKQIYDDQKKNNLSTGRRSPTRSEEGYVRATLDSVGAAPSLTVLFNDDDLDDTERNLWQLVHQIERRLEWLGKGSRRVFGTIAEDSVTFVLDFSGGMTRLEHELKQAVRFLISDQLPRDNRRFNFVAYAEEAERWERRVVDVNAESMECAWLWLRDLRPGHKANIADALALALEDKQTQAVYLVSCGRSTTNADALLCAVDDANRRRKTGRIPVHVTAYEPETVDGEAMLRAIAAETRGRFHSFAVRGPPVSSDSDDVRILEGELTAAKDVLVHIMSLRTGILREVRPTSRARSRSPMKTGSPSRHDKCHTSPVRRDPLERARSPEAKKSGGGGGGGDDKGGKKDDDATRLDSRAWLKKNGISKDCAKSIDETLKSRSCPHAVVHSLDSHEKTLKKVLKECKERVKWLRQGSRELFGNITEKRPVFCVDISEAMVYRMDYVRDQLRNLLQEQVKNTEAFNLLCFDTAVDAWARHTVTTGPRSIDSAREWIRDTDVGSGQVSIEGVLKVALADPDADAVYLVVSGVPLSNRDAMDVLDTVRMVNSRRIPIHVVTFCVGSPKQPSGAQQAMAEQFGMRLAAQTNGRYHSVFWDGGRYRGAGDELRVVKAEVARARELTGKLSKFRGDTSRCNCAADGPLKKHKAPSCQCDDRPIRLPGIRGASEREDRKCHEHHHCGDTCFGACDGRLTPCSPHRRCASTGPNCDCWECARSCRPSSRGVRLNDFVLGRRGVPTRKRRRKR